MKGLVAARKEECEPKKSVRLGALKGWIKIKRDIVHSDMEDDWEVQRRNAKFAMARRRYQHASRVRSPERRMRRS
jgi:hypothetical protein